MATSLRQKTYYSDWNSSSPSGLPRTEATTRLAGGIKWILFTVLKIPKHILILVGIGVSESPESATLSLLNDLAFAQGWKPVFPLSYYAGTFGGYDRDAFRRVVKET